MTPLFTGPGDGAAVLDDVRAFLARFVAFPTDQALDAVTLWAAHAHPLDAFESTPRLALLSPEPGSGKTRGLEVLDLLVPRPMFTLNASAAALFRKVSDPDGRPTVLLDESDTIFGPRAAKEHEDLRGFVNGGHRRGAMATRCVVRGKTIEVEDYPCYAAVALAGLDDLPDTIMTRSVVVRMRRRAPYERVEPFRYRLHATEGHALRDRLAAWTATVADRLAEDWPELPEGVEDRAADVWEPLLALADAAGGHWPDRARAAAVSFVADAQGNAESLGVRLLSDLRAIFGGSDKLATEHILIGLHGLAEAPWGDLRGKPLDARGLSRRLGKYGVHSTTVRLDDGRIAKGYKRAELIDAWARYVPDDPGSSPSPQRSVTSVTAVTAPAEPPAAVTDVTDVTDPPGEGDRPGCAKHPDSAVNTANGRCVRCILDGIAAERAVGPALCAVCDLPLDPVIVAEGGSTHPGCDLDQLAFGAGTERDEAAS